MIEVTEIVKRYGELTAVDKISFCVETGEALGLLGPNGAGKTTTIHMLLGVLKPDSGQIQIQGQADPTRPKVRQMIGAAPQALSLYGNLTGEENVRFFGQLYGLSGKSLQERVTWSLDFVGLLSRRKDQAHTYSGGMQRRLNMACALVHDPQVIFLDEPTVGVDPQSRNQILENIEALKKMGRTILYTTHYMEEAQRLCDRVAIIDHGRLLDVGTVDALLKAHGGNAVVEVVLRELPEQRDTLPGRLDDHTLRIETEQPLEVVAQLAGEGLVFQQIKVEQADLETVFLNLTGRSLRDG